MTSPTPRVSQKLPKDSAAAKVYQRILDKVNTVDKMHYINHTDTGVVCAELCNPDNYKELLEHANTEACECAPPPRRHRHARQFPPHALRTSRPALLAGSSTVGSAGSRTSSIRCISTPRPFF